MAIIPITVYGDKVLRQKAKPVSAVGDTLIVKIKNMLDTMKNAKGVGIAANQLSYRESVFLIDLNGVEGYDNFKPIVMINPKIVKESDEVVKMEEGCLSLPNLRAEVVRPAEIKIRYLDTDENERELDAGEFFARVILHEYDHLHGKLIPDRVGEEVKNQLKNELNRIMNRDVEIEYPITEG